MQGLKKHGIDLIRKGYEIVPVFANQKRPSQDSWTTRTFDEPWVEKAIVNGSAECGVGIKSRFTPAVDIDISDKVIQGKVLD